MILSRAFRTLSRFSTAAVPNVDMTRYLNQAEGWKNDCDELVRAARDYGILYVKDPRVLPSQHS